MKSKLLVVAILALVASGCSKLPQYIQGASFRAQISELVDRKDAGTISEQEYRHSRHSLLNRMLH